jgi:hypothetical protein
MELHLAGVVLGDDHDVFHVDEVGLLHLGKLGAQLERQMLLGERNDDQITHGYLFGSQIALSMLVDEITTEGTDTGADQRARSGLRTESPDRGAGCETERGAGSDTGPGGVSAAAERKGSDKG